MPWLVVVHRPAGGYAGSLATLLDATPPGGDDARVSAHVLTGGPAGVAAQLVPWDRKAWACALFNSASYNVESDDRAWLAPGSASGSHLFHEAARIVAFLCKRTGIPPAWSREPLHTPGVVRHLDLGRAGGGHSDPTRDVALWREFVAAVRAEHERGGFKPTWGAGALHRIDV